MIGNKWSVPSFRRTRLIMITFTTIPIWSVFSFTLKFPNLWTYVARIIVWTIPISTRSIGHIEATNPRQPIPTALDMCKTTTCPSSIVLCLILSSASPFMFTMEARIIHHSVTKAYASKIWMKYAFTIPTTLWSTWPVWSLESNATIIRTVESAKC